MIGLMIISLVDYNLKGIAPGIEFIYSYSNVRELTFKLTNMKLSKYILISYKRGIKDLTE